MILVDSSGWVEYFMNGPLIERYAHYFSSPREVLTPTIVVYEVYKKIKNELDQEHALIAAAQMEETHLVPLSESLAYHAANLSLEHKLAMADAIVYATADIYRTKLVTSDKDFKDLPGVIYLGPEEDPAS